TPGATTGKSTPFSPATRTAALPSSVTDIPVRAPTQICPVCVDAAMAPRMIKKRGMDVALDYTHRGMHLQPFAMERWQSTYENEVAFNLSESGVHPLTVGELLDDPQSRHALLQEGLRYTQSNGTAELRALVALQYPGATVDHVEITNGGSEANYIAMWSLVRP